MAFTRSKRSSTSVESGATWPQATQRAKGRRRCSSGSRDGPAPTTKRTGGITSAPTASRSSRSRGARRTASTWHPAFDSNKGGSASARRTGFQPTMRPCSLRGTASASSLRRLPGHLRGHPGVGTASGTRMREVPSRPKKARGGARDARQLGGADGRWLSIHFEVPNFVPASVAQGT